MPNNSYSSGVICLNEACKGKIFISLQNLLNKNLSNALIVYWNGPYKASNLLKISSVQGKSTPI